MFTKLTKVFLDKLSKKYPAVKFLREYSPKDYDRNEFLRKVMNFVSESKMAGDYLEFGVYKGSNFVNAIRIAKGKRLERMKFYAFDSFEGLPDIAGVDLEFKQFKSGELSFSLNKFEDNLRKNGVDFSKIVIVRGFFKDTLVIKIKSGLGIKSAAVIWVDCDLYESTTLVLNFVIDYITDGTILVFDDWYHFRGDPNKGEQRAFREWLQANPNLTATEFHKYSWHGNSFIISKNG